MSCLLDSMSLRASPHRGKVRGLGAARVCCRACDPPQGTAWGICGVLGSTGERGISLLTRAGRRWDPVPSVGGLPPWHHLLGLTADPEVLLLTWHLGRTLWKSTELTAPGGRLDSAEPGHLAASPSSRCPGLSCAQVWEDLGSFLGWGAWNRGRRCYRTWELAGRPEPAPSLTKRADREAGGQHSPAQCPGVRVRSRWPQQGAGHTETPGGQGWGEPPGHALSGSCPPGEARCLEPLALAARGQSKHLAWGLQPGNSRKPRRRKG